MSEHWFTEFVPNGPGGKAAFGATFQVSEKLYEEQTPIQKIEIYQNPLFGKVLVFDGLVMLTEKDNYLYHEMMSHPVLFTHKSPKNVAIIGGGDCGTLQEVLKHLEVKQVTQIDIDERVTRVCEKYFPELCASNQDTRAEFLFEDGIKWMANAAPGSLDVIIVDCTDPVDAAEGLFEKPFYDACFKALNTGGILVQQSESPFFHQELIRNMRAKMKAAEFTEAKTLFFPQPTYPSGSWSATMAFKGRPMEGFRVQDALNKVFETKYYNAAIHEAALALPEALVRELEYTSES